MDPRTAVRRLLTAGKKPAPALVRAIVELGDAAVPFLVEIVDDRRLYDTAAASHGWAPLHAMHILAELRATPGLSSLFAIVETAPVESAAFSQAIFALAAFGSDALEPTLARYAATDDADRKTSYAEILSDLKIKDERIYQILVDTYDLDPPLGASHMQAYGDPKALPLLLERLDGSDDLLEILAIDDAVKALGGELGRRQQAKVKHATEEMAERHAQHRRRR